jgi:hypothetical protein
VSIQKKNSTPYVDAAATSWLSVSAERKSPHATNAAARQPEPQIARDERAPVDVMHAREDHRIDERRGEHDRHDAEAGEELAGDDLAVAERDTSRGARAYPAGRSSRTTAS